jgi:hypothetical protein
MTIPRAGREAVHAPAFAAIVLCYFFFLPEMEFATRETALRAFGTTANASSTTVASTFSMVVAGRALRAVFFFAGARLAAPAALRADLLRADALCAGAFALLFAFDGALRVAFTVRAVFFLAAIKLSSKARPKGRITMRERE